MQLLMKISETIGIMVSDLMDKITLSEFALWGAWFELKHDAEKDAINDAKKDSLSKNPKIRRPL